MTDVHPTAVVHKGACIDGAVVGPYCVVGPKVRVGEGSRLRSHVVMDGDLEAGRDNDFFPFSSLGHAPQDIGYAGEPTRVSMGDGNVIREYVSVHRGTAKDRGVTSMGDGNLLMATVHLGHDVSLGSRCVVANSSNLAGHVKIADRVIVGGNVQISQYVSVGRGAYIWGASAIDRDIPQFCSAVGNRAKLKGINIIGMRRQGFDRQVIMELVNFYRTMEGSALSPKSFVEQEDLMQGFQDNAIIREMVDFIKGSRIGIAPFVS